MVTIRGPGVFALSVTLLLGGAGGYAARSMMEGPARTSGEAPMQDAGVRDALVRLERAVEEVNGRLDARLAAPPAREPAQAATPDLDLGELRELVSRFTQAAARAEGNRSTSSLLVPDKGSQPVPSKPESNEDWTELRRHWPLSTYQQVLDELGRPDRISGARYDQASCVLWMYRRGTGAIEDGFKLFFCDGIVIGVEP